MIDKEFTKAMFHFNYNLKWLQDGRCRFPEVALLNTWDDLMLAINLWLDGAGPDESEDVLRSNFKVVVAWARKINDDNLPLIPNPLDDMYPYLLVIGSFDWLADSGDAVVTVPVNDVMIQELLNAKSEWSFDFCARTPEEEIG